jgi:hypothetical protein
MEDQHRYNGWANYETWAVHLHLTNEQGSDSYWREAALEAKQHAKDEPHEFWTEEQHATYDLADRLKDEIAMADLPEIVDSDKEPALMYSDLLRCALDSVDWSEIAKAFLED